MRKTIAFILFFVTIPGAAHALVQVSLSSLAKSPSFKTRTLANGKVCTRGIVSSVDFKSIGSNQAPHAKVAVLNIRSYGGFNRERNALLATVVFSGDDSRAGLAMSNLIYRNAGNSSAIEVCENGDLRILPF